jgi:hypothetical protein
MLRNNVVRFALLFLIGAIFGGSAVEVAHRSHDTQVLFNQKLKCQKLTSGYQKSTSMPGIGTIVELIDFVDYSPARSSCIAATRRFMPMGLRAYGVIDVVTQESLWDKTCSDSIPTPPPSPNIPMELRSDCKSKEPSILKARD